jgi:hypothetical protein
MILNRILQIVILILFSCATSIAQKPGLTELTYLKNGGIIRGAIVELIPNDVVKIKTTDGSVVVYSMDDVEKVLRETNQNTTIDDLRSSENLEGAENNTKLKESGYFNATEIVFGFGMGKIKRTNSSFTLSNTSTFYGVRSSHGYFLGRHMIVGIALGIEGGNIGPAYVPLYMDCRFPFGNNKTKLSLNVTSGLAFLYSEPVYIINPSIGIKRYVTKKASFNFSVGTYSRSMFIQNNDLNIIEYALSQPDYYGNYYPLNKRYRYLFSDILVAVGFSF